MLTYFVSNIAVQLASKDFIIFLCSKGSINATQRSTLQKWTGKVRGRARHYLNDWVSSCRGTEKICKAYVQLLTYVFNTNLHSAACIFSINFMHPHQLALVPKIQKSSWSQFEMGQDAISMTIRYYLLLKTRELNCNAEQEPAASRKQ